MKSGKLKWFSITVFWLLLWQLLAMFVGSSLLLPSPVETVAGLLSLLGDSKFYMDVAATIGRCALAMVLALAAGLLLALLSYRHRIVRDVLSLPVAFFKAVPVMAVAIYMLLLLTSGSVPILVCWVMCFPIVYTNLLTGLDSMDADILEMAKLYRIEGYRRIRHIYIPSLFPYFKSAMSLIAGMSWKAIVTAEVLSVPKFSLGYELMNSKYYLNTNLLFAYVLVIILISVLFEKLIKMGLAKMEPHEYEGSKVLKPGSAEAARKSDAAAGKSDEVARKSEEVAGGPRVEIRKVSKAYDDKLVLDKFNLILEGGKTTALMGQSGAGKTTVGRLLCGEEQVDSGEIIFSKETSIAVLFQEDRLLPWLNVYDNMALVSKRDELIRELLAAVGLGEELHSLPTQLSGGMSRRVAIARAFAYAKECGADLIIADEPFRGLDEATRRNVIERLWQPGVAGRTVLLITHSQEDANELADEIVRI